MPVQTSEHGGLGTVAVCQSRGTAMSGQTSEHGGLRTVAVCQSRGTVVLGQTSERTQDSGCMPVQGNCMPDQTSEKETQDSGCMPVQGICMSVQGKCNPFR